MKQDSSIAIFGTGDEIINGDILDTNSRAIAQAFLPERLLIKTHVMVRDNRDDQLAMLKFLLETHEIILCMGGLGPTGDDLTRFTLAEALGLELQEHQPSWDKIQARFASRGFGVVSERNRQQVLFPVEGEVLPNLTGSADGWMWDQGEQFFAMLPGPPNQCMPLVEKHIIPALKQRGAAIPWFRHSWLIAGFPESRCAEVCEPLAAEAGCEIGFRFCPPNLEVKLMADDKGTLAKGIKLVEPALKDFIV